MGVDNVVLVLLPHRRASHGAYLTGVYLTTMGVQPIGVYLSAAARTARPLTALAAGIG